MSDSQNNSNQQTNPLLEKVKNANLEQLIDLFNQQVGNQGWTSSKAAYLNEMHLAFTRLNIDCSAIICDNRMNLSKQICFQDGAIQQMP